MAYHSGISPPTDPSSEDRSRTGDEGRRAPGRVPAAMSIVRSISERPQQQGRRSNQSTKMLRTYLLFLLVGLLL